MKIIRRIDNNKKSQRMYGYDMKGAAASIVSASLDTRQMVKANDEIFSMEIEKSTVGNDKIKISYNDSGKIKENLKISYYTRSESELESENYLLSTYKEVSKKLDIREIKCSDFLDEVKARLINDVRYAYKRFHIVANKNTRHSVHIYRIYAIMIATLSIMNEMDFKIPILIKLGMEREGLTLQIEIKLKNKNVVNNKKELLKKPSNEAKLIYLGALCNQDETTNGLFLEGNRIVLRYVIDEVPVDRFKLCSKAPEENEFFERYMDIFNSSFNDKGAGTIEEE